jgi:hypothetical protein
MAPVDGRSELGQLPPALQVPFLSPLAMLREAGVILSFDSLVLAIHKSDIRLESAVPAPIRTRVRLLRVEFW